MKRFLFIITTFILCFFVSVHSVFAADSTSSDATGYNSWTFAEKAEYWGRNFYSIAGSFLGLDVQSLDDAALTVGYPSIATEGYSSYKEFLAAHSSFDDDSQTLSVDDEGLAFLNYVKVEAEEEITYQNMYLPDHSQIPSGVFNTKSAYNLFVELVKQNPDKIFSTYTHNGHPVIKEGEDSSSSVYGIGLTVCDADLSGGVSSNIKSGLGIINANIYDADWVSVSTRSDCLNILVVDDSTFPSCIYYLDKSGNPHYVYSVDDVANIDFSDVACRDVNYATERRYLSSVHFGSSYRSFSSIQSLNGINNGNYYAFTDYNGTFPVFDTLAHLKEGTSSGKAGQYMPGYTTGDVIDNSVTQTEINDYSTNYNYYYGSSSDDGSGSGSGGSSSGSSWLDSLLSGLGSLGDAILNILGKLLDYIGKAVTFITDGIADILDLAENGFTKLMTEFFPFIPEEWVTAVTLAMGLALLALVIRIFKG